MVDFLRFASINVDNVGDNVSNVGDNVLNENKTTTSTTTSTATNPGKKLNKDLHYNVHNMEHTIHQSTAGSTTDTTLPATTVLDKNDAKKYSDILEKMDLSKRSILVATLGFESCKSPEELATETMKNLHSPCLYEDRCDFHLTKKLFFESRWFMDYDIVIPLYSDKLKKLIEFAKRLLHTNLKDLSKKLMLQISEILSLEFTNIADKYSFQNVIFASAYDTSIWVSKYISKHPIDCYSLFNPTYIDCSDVIKHKTKNLIGMSVDYCNNNEYFEHPLITIIRTAIYQKKSTISVVFYKTTDNVAGHVNILSNYLKIYKK